jgi:hypothetical protein
MEIDRKGIGKGNISIKENKIEQNIPADKNCT